MTGGNGRLGAAGPLWAEEFRKQGPCRFGRSAAVEGGITGVEPGSAKEGRAGRSQQSCLPKDAPTLDDVPRGNADPGITRQPCGGCWFLASYARGQAHPGQFRARLIRPKSCRYHFAAEALLTLI